jgi:hypothetical protein
MPTRVDLFSYTFNQLRDGLEQAEASEKLNECVLAAEETGKAATLTVKLTIKPNGRGQQLIAAKTDHNLPEHPKSATIMFPTGDGNLQREDPNQINLPLRSVDEPAPSIQLKKAD